MFGRRQDHIRTEEKYRLLREITYESVMEEYPGVVAKGITMQSAYMADKWSEVVSDSARKQRAPWEWVKEFPYYQSRPNRFEISLWGNNELGALCYGQTSVRGTKVRMNLIESTPVRPSPLGMRALPILSFAAAIFADIVGADELWILDPDPRLENLYMDEGFESRSIYHGRRVGQRRIL
ncbi:hypothetical protein GCM10007877_36720 [Marinibactrum halimedae]|uniref:Uncharacterized protein n=2 Tax=Marinibactrum halimedae TaxID=1444977 RepID=A0AA37T5W5_9GAMM|nr:hypothetical protein GCM10007877_36720 [Marinibactrum halimedae]